MTNNHTDRSHSKLGGSSADRWCNCPGSVFYLDELPPQATSDAMLDGTAAHEVAEIVLENFLELKISGTEATINLPDHDPDHIEAALFYQETIWEKLLHQSITGKAYGMEERFAIDDSLHMAGFIDFWAVYIDDKAKRAGIIADFKYGFHKVKAKNNAQLGFYAVAMRKSLRKLGKDIDYIRAAIIQPRLTSPADQFQEVKFTGKQLDTWEAKFYKAAEQIFVKKEPKFKIGDWCYFCPAKAICKTYNKEVNSKTSLKIIDPENTKLPAPESMSKEQLEKVVLHYDTLKNFLDSCYQYVFDSLRNGKDFKNLKLVEGKSRRKWKDKADSIAADLIDAGIAEPTVAKLKPLTQIEKELIKLHGKEAGEKLIQSHVEKGQALPILVPSDDPRPKVVSALDKLNTIKE